MATLFESPTGQQNLQGKRERGKLEVEVGVEGGRQGQKEATGSEIRADKAFKNLIHARDRQRLRCQHGHVTCLKLLHP